MTKEEVMALFVDDVKVRKDTIRNYIMDKSNAYEDRLEVWRKTPDHLHTTASDYISLTNFEYKYGEISWYDDFYVERYCVLDLTEVNVDDRFFDGDEEMFRAFCEECMDKGYHAFVYDW